MRQGFKNPLSELVGRLGQLRSVQRIQLRLQQDPYELAPTDACCHLVSVKVLENYPI